MSATLTPNVLEAVAGLAHVRRIEPVRSLAPAEVPPYAVERLDPEGERGAFYGVAVVQQTMINVPAVHARGYTGAGTLIGVLDTGYRVDHVAFQHAERPLRVRAEFDFINDDGNVGIEEGDPEEQHRHGTFILGTLAGYAPGDYVGVAFDAEYLLAKTEDTTQEVPIEEDWYVAGLEWIEAHGADVATSSLGYIDWYTQADLDGLTAVTTIAVNLATARGLVCVTAAGNSGHGDDVPTLIAPADAFEVITVSAVNAEGETATFASRGPTADLRVKPEVQARGVRTRTVNAAETEGYVQVSGTSLSTPQIAGVVALLLQAHPHWTVEQVRTALFTTSSYFVEHGTHDPEFVKGYGIVDALAALKSVLCTCDINGDGVIGTVDALHMLDCYSGPGVPGAPELLPPEACLAAFDLDRDGDVDLHDLAMFQFEFTGDAGE